MKYASSIGLFERLPEKIILIRHLQPNTPSRILLGHSNVDIVIPKKETVDSAKENLEAILRSCNIPTHLSSSTSSSPSNKPTDLPNTLVFTSDLLRASKTAQLFLPDFPQNNSPLLREVNFGDFEMMNWPYLEEHEGKFYKKYMENWQELSFPGGESVKDLITRVKDFFISTTFDPNVAFIFAHAGTINAANHILTATPIERFFSIDAGYGSLHLFKKEPKKHKTPSNSEPNFTSYQKYIYSKISIS